MTNEPICHSERAYASEESFSLLIRQAASPVQGEVLSDSEAEGLSDNLTE